MSKTDQPIFSGFDPKSLGFLKALGFHQNREWFHENKKLYETLIKQPMGEFLDAASARFAQEGIPLHGTRQACMFRVNRDVRFSKNKDPYNTHASAVLTRNGTKKDSSGAYIHIKPEKCLFAAGLWFPEAQQLRALREAIIDRSDEFIAIEEALNKAGLVFTTDNSLKRVPPAFKHVEDETVMRLLKHKSFVVERMIEDAHIQEAELLDSMVELVKQTMPLMQFCWRVIDPLKTVNES